jgi:hypothetical protein
MKISISWANHPKNVTEKITKINNTMWINEQLLEIGTNKKYKVFGIRWGGWQEQHLDDVFVI